MRNDTTRQRAAWRSSCLALALATLACSGPRPQDEQDRRVGTATTKEVGGVKYRLEEQAHDGKYDVPADQLKVVDANSDLVLTFEHGGAAATPSAEWSTVNGLLEQVTGLEQEREKLIQEARGVDRSEPAVADAFRAKVAAFGKKVVGLIQKLKEYGLSSAEQVSIMLGETPGEKPKSYANLKAWLSKRIESLSTRLSVTIESNARLEVAVQAFLDHPGAKRQAIHVEKYDELPLGELRPIDRYRLNMTPAEESQFRMEVAQAETAATWVREIGKLTASSDRQTSQLLDQLQAEARSLLERLDHVEAWLPKLQALTQDLQARAQADDEAGRALAVIVQQTKEFQLDAAVGADLRSHVDKLGAMLKDSSHRSLSDVLFMENGVLADLGAVDADVTKLVAAVGSWGKRLSDIRDALPKASDAVREVVTKTFTEEAMQLLDSIVHDVPALAALLQATRSLIESFQGTEQLAETKQDPTLFQPLDEAPDGRVELARAGLTEGDVITINTTFRDASGKKVVHEDTYKTEARLTGIHRVIGANLIFARGVSGTAEAEKWKPNIAAVADWHYYVRDAEGATAVWNWLDPGLGIHLASLDQGDESVEFGIGVNCSFWGGLLNGGYGWNLSVDEDREYYFVGINLFDVLNGAKKAQGGL